MIIDAIDPLNQNNNALKDQFLGNMYRIVSTHSKFNMCFLLPFDQSHKNEYRVSSIHFYIYVLGILIVVLQIKSNF